MPALLGATTIVISKIGMPVSGLCHLTSRGRRIKFPLLRRYNFPAARGVRHHHMQKTMGSQKQWETMGSGLPIPTYSLGNGRPDPRTFEDHFYDMNDYFRETGREVLSDQAVASDLKAVNFKNKQFERLVATKKRFTDCDFSYSHFDSAYLRNCTFDSCKFIGSKFTNSNLRGSRFEGCVFDYAEFSQTQIEPEILDTGCPGQENLQQKFARTLRVNFNQIGDAVSANKAIKIELAAGRVHLYKAWRSRESYYRKKYPGIKRAAAFLEWLEFILLDAFWGNGESPIKLLRTLVFILLVIAIGEVYFIKDPKILSNYIDATRNAPQVFLGVLQPVGFSGLVLAGIAAVRYVMLACLVSILVKRFSRR
jgi:hypothetical protein